MCSNSNFFYHQGEITAWAFIIPEKEMLLTQEWNYKSWITPISAMLNSRTINTMDHSTP